MAYKDWLEFWMRKDATFKDFVYALFGYWESTRKGKWNKILEFQKTLTHL